MTVARLADAVRAGDVVRVRSMFKKRPEPVNIDMAANNEHRALHDAVLNRATETVRVPLRRVSVQGRSAGQDDLEMLWRRCRAWHHHRAK